MRIVIQRVTQASVTIDEKVKASIGKGYLILLGIEERDGQEDIDFKIKGRFNYSELHEISTEGRQKLERIDPETLAQASRIPGVSPSDINVLLVLLGR